MYVNHWRFCYSAPDLKRSVVLAQPSLSWLCHSRTPGMKFAHNQFDSQNSTLRSAEWKQMRASKSLWWIVRRQTSFQESSKAAECDFTPSLAMRFHFEILRVRFPNTRIVICILSILNSFSIWLCSHCLSTFEVQKRGADWCCVASKRSAHTTVPVWTGKGGLEVVLQWTLDLE